MCCMCTGHTNSKILNNKSTEWYRQEAYNGVVQKGIISEFRGGEAPWWYVYMGKVAKTTQGCFPGLVKTVTMSECAKFPRMKEKGRQNTVSLAKGIKIITFNPAKPYCMCFEIATYIPLTKGDDKEQK